MSVEITDTLLCVYEFVFVCNYMNQSWL